MAAFVFRYSDPSGLTLFSPGCMDGQIGSLIRWTFRETDDGPVKAELGWLRVLAYDIEDDGHTLALTVEEAAPDAEAATG